jgi:site-specific DNA-methyltransferase (adenine-specific)
MPTGTFYVGDVTQGCPSVEDASCDLIITSPPYFKCDGYSDALMTKTGEIFGRVLKPGGRAYVIISQINENLDLPMDAQRAILSGGKKSLIPGQTIIWVKSIAVGGWQEKCPEPTCGHRWKTDVVSRGHFQPINSPNLLNYCYEFVLCFMKPPLKDAHPLDRKGIGVGYADPTNITRWKNAADAVHCPGDVWFIPYETTGSTIKKTHRHEFPQELARRLIVVSGIPDGSTVFDPFAGGGTSLFAARDCGMNAVGNDINDDGAEHPGRTT